MSRQFIVSVILMGALLPACSRPAAPLPGEAATQVTHDRQRPAEVDLILPNHARALSIARFGEVVQVENSQVIASSLKLLQSATPGPAPEYDGVDGGFTLTYQADSGEVVVRLRQEIARVEPSTYLRGPTLRSLLDLADGQFHASSRLAAKVRRARSIVLQARDRSQSIVLNATQQAVVADLLAQGSYLVDPRVLGGSLYPSFELTVAGDKETVLRLLIPEYLEASHAAYAVPVQLWQELGRWLPDERTSKGGLSDLFQANRLEVTLEADQAEPSWRQTLAAEEVIRRIRIQSMVRALSEGKRKPDGAIKAGPVMGRLVFTVEGRQVEVEVGSDWFRIQGQVFARPDAAKDIRSILLAG